MLPRYLRNHEIFVQNVRRLLESRLLPKVDEWERKGYFPDEVFEILGTDGYLGILIPEQYGGIGGDYELAAAWCDVFGELPAVGLTTGVNMHSLVVSKALAAYGSEELKSKWLPRAVQGKAIGAYAFTEPNAGSDLAGLKTRAEKTSNGWLINGSKTFITNGARAHFVLVLARTDPSAGYQGFTTFVVDTSLAGFKVNRTLDKLGWRSSDTAELSFENLEVPDSAVLGAAGTGWPHASASLNWERLMLTLTSLGGARCCYKQSLQYAKDRRAFGRSLIEFDALRQDFKRMFCKIKRGEALIQRALDVLVSGDESRALVSAAKRLVCEDAVWIADRCIQIHGGYGYTTEFSPERWWRDLRLMPIGGGTSEIMANIVIKEMGWG